MLETKIPRPEYPRPQFVRNSFSNLNGEWEFVFDDENVGLKEKWFEKADFNKKIVVPFVYQSECSGIGDRSFHNVVWYRKKVTIQREDGCARLMLHFGAVDYWTKVWVNGTYVGAHTGGNTPFSFEITDIVKMNAENEIVVRVEDDAQDLEIPRGKQYWKPHSEGIFYTGTTGIWQTVWLEQLPENYLEKTWVTPDVDEKRINIRMNTVGDATQKIRVRISFHGTELVNDVIDIKNHRAERSFWIDQRTTMDWNHQESMVWTPENPVLFDLEYTLMANGLECDHVTSYGALRKVEVVNGQFMLNNTPYYQKMLLDQGYWRQSLMTAPTDEAFVSDIEACKKMGFNGVRKHQKVEDPRYLYHADKMGFLVWSEISSAYVYSREYAKKMVTEWMDVIVRDYNHPCIVCWVPLNESWGVDCIMNRKEEQDHATSMYYLTKSMDQTRMVISNDGWNHTVSDLFTVHDYDGSYDNLKKRYESAESLLPTTPGHRTLFAKGYQYSGQPILVSEFGGIAYKKQTEATNGDNNDWGYTTADSADAFVKQFADVVTALQESPLVQGYVYTQICDVEQEINGLLTYDREFKVDPELIRKINEKR